jgi:hypothetical protein
MGADALLLSLALALLPPPQEKPSVAVTAVSPWPSSVSRGYAPVHVELQNLLARPLEIDLDFEGQGARGQVTFHEHVALAALARGAFDFTVPLLGVPLAELRLEVGVGPHPPKLVVSSVARDPAPRHLLFVPDDVDPSHASGGPSSAWRDKLVTAVDAEAPAPVSSSPPGFPPGRIVMGRLRPALLGGRSGNVAAVGVAADALPSDAACYTSVDGVAIDFDRAPPRAEALDALLAWVRMGGRLVLFSDSWRDVPHKLPGVDAWHETRFRLGSDPLWFSTRCGAGRILFASRTCPDQPGFGHVFADFLSADDWSVPLRAATQAMEWPALATLPGVDAIPRRSAALLLLLFVVVIGPVNAVFVRRMGRPTLGLVTIPAIALVASLLFLAYGIFRQGLDVKTASLSFSLLDQRQRRATTIELRELFAGLARGRGLAPAAGTLVSPYPAGSSFDDMRPGYSVDDEDARNDVYSVAGSSSRRLGGAFLPPRIESRQLLISDAAARPRLELHRKGDHGGRLVAANGLGVTIERLLLRDEQGKLHAAFKVAAGAEVELAPVAGTFAVDARDELYYAVHYAFSPSNELPPGTYAAKLAGSPFTDAAGIELNEVRGAHFVVGILDLSEEAWR